MKKSKYINKYDYMSYYTKPKGMWFFSNTEIQSALETEIHKIKEIKHSNLDVEDLEDDEEETSDSDGEIDFYEYYKERLESNKSIDENNPQIIMGKIIDVESRKHIVNTYKDIKNIFDLEEIYKITSNEKLANATKEYLQKYDNVILFQSVFIYKNLITKPDAIVKKDGVITIIETKGTTSAKFIHYLDLYFQMQVIENQDYLKNENYLFDYLLCLIEYSILNKNEISFELCPNINLKKTVAVPKEHKSYVFDGIDLIRHKNAIKKGNAFLSEYLEPLNTKDLMYDKWDSLEQNIECSIGISKKAQQKAKDKLLLINYHFDDAIKALEEHKKTLNDSSIPYFIPSSLDKSPYKNCDFFPIERKLFAMQGYNIFDYSGLIANQNEMYLDNAKINDNIDNFLKKPKKNPQVFVQMFGSSKKVMIDKNATKLLFDEIKPKKVYFDFETINTPIRVIDNSLPFMQIVTQCSIIKYDSEIEKLENVICDNLIIDPININIEWFKKVVDGIYYHSENNDVSYIVYNKSFEQTRLLEIANMIKEKEYTKKIEIIVKNLFDLADFFKLRSENPTHKIFFNELGGFYSIKKVLPLIDKYAQDIYAVTKCLNYNDLEIKNGQICQTETVKRFFKIIDDKQWKNVEKQMQIYCENDVRAMIAVEYLVKGLLEKTINIYNKEN